MGMCLRDSSGSFVKAQTFCIPQRLAVAEGEALGLLYALNWAVELNFQQVHFEVYSQMVVNNVSSTKCDFSTFGTLI